MPTMLAITSLKMDGGTQPRASTLFDVVEEYAGAMAMGADAVKAVEDIYLYLNAK